MKRFGFLFVLPLLALADCGGGGEGAGNASCRSILTRFAECGIFEGGNLECHGEAETQFQACVADCVDQASCEDIAEYACELEPNACLDDCIDARFTCDNGQSVQTLRQCDGFEDCDDGSDEAQCAISIWRCNQYPPHDEIPGTLVCDGQQDCTNGSDEEDCGELACLSEASVSESAPTLEQALGQGAE